MFRTATKIAVIAGMVVIAGCNQQDADALAKIGHIVVERAKSLPELKSPSTVESKDKPQKSEPPG